jgi:hypothetical protein
MDGYEIVRQFERIGARAQVRIFPNATFDRVRLNVLRDGRGEYFDVLAGPRMHVRVVDARADMRHLLLMGVPGESGASRRGGDRFRFLCGHDERHWFVAAVPGARGVSNVRTAMEALKPEAVLREQERFGVRGRDGVLRRTGAYVRQGEWFIVPRPEMTVPPNLILRHEPITRSGLGAGRGGSKPHWVDEVYRTGGDVVYVNRAHPNGITQDEYSALVARDSNEKRNQWRVMRRNATAFARGRIRHPDHATITLPVWHEVLMNTESRAPGMEMVAFLD